ncbi:MAG: lamin tail domain-containing protein [Verrucomicrobiota bacterium]
MQVSFSASRRGLPRLFLMGLGAVALHGAQTQTQAQVRLTEFLASNESGKKDQNGEFSDWVEIHNAGPAAVSLLDWSLTDKADNKNKWRFPAVSLAPGGYLVVFASEKNRADPAAELHTNFKLGAGGEYLALVQPDGTVATEYAPVYPQQLPDISYGLSVADGAYTAAVRYFQQPTPGAVNGTGASDLGPVFSHPAHSPARPAEGENVMVTVKVARTFADIAEVRLRWIVMYDSATNVLKDVILHDDGLAGDAVAGDGTFSGIIPGTVTVDTTTTNTFAAGRLIRWYFTARDTAAGTSRFPLFPEPLNSPEYLGTVAKDPANFTTPMPVWYWFAKNTGAAATDAGTRGSVFFKDQYYDNIAIRRRGGATSTDSKKFDFNSGDHCFIDDTVGRVEEANINISGQDTTLVRPAMGFEAYRTTGHPGCAAFPMLQRMGGSPTVPTTASYTNLMTYYVEQVDTRFLERWGLDPNGALYKMNQKSNLDPVFTDSTDGVEKKTRETENNADLGLVCTALKKRTTDALREQRAVFMFDNFDLANMVNYLAVRAVINDYDDVRKNFYIYRDTLGDKEWKLLPWDKDGCFGVTGDGGTWLAHPFFGDFAHLKQNANQWNLLWEAIFNDPATRAMYLRRLRSLMDSELQPASVPLAERYFEKRADFWGAQFSPAKSVTAVKSFLNTRRTQLYTTYATTSATVANRLIPPAQAAAPGITFGAVETNPASGKQGEEFIEIVNPDADAVDVSGWTVSGGIDHTFRPGTVIPANSKMYLANSAPAFRARTTGPTGGQKLFVQGGWSGSLSARGETLTLKNPVGLTVAGLSTPAAPTAAQSALRVTKIMYDPPAGGAYAASDYEYLELRNTGTETLDLGGVFFDKGITFTFAAGATLAPGARILLVKNQEAFASRYGAGLPVGGVFTGSLDNSGERLRILDGVGEEVLDFAYDPLWSPSSSGGGTALVAVDDTALWTVWDTAAGWRASISPNGSPGSADAEPVPLPVLAPGTGVGSFSVTGTPGSIWKVQRSTDLQTWAPAGTVTVGASGTAVFTDAAPPVSGKAFYRCAR